MESLVAEAVPSCSRGADAPGPSVRERQACRRGQMSVHQRDDQCRGDAELRSARLRQMPDERDTRHRDDGQSRRSARARQTPTERDARRLENAEEMRSARARQTPAEIDTRHLENAEGMRSARAPVTSDETRPTPGGCGATEDCSERKTGCLAPGLVSPTGTRSPQPPPPHSPWSSPSLLRLQSLAAVWGDGVPVLS